MSTLGKKFVRRRIPIDPTIPDLSNDPVVLKKVELGREIIRKNGLPKDWSKKKP